MAIDPSLVLRFESLSGERLTALPEWDTAWLLFAGAQLGPSQALQFYRLEVDGLILPLQWQPERQLLMALWQRQGPGIYPVTLWYQSERCFERELQVWPKGWGQSGLFALLEDLSYHLPYEWGRALKRGAGYVPGKSTETRILRGWRQEFARLQECLLDASESSVGLLSALADWEPNQTLGLPPELRPVPAYQARNPLFRTVVSPGLPLLDQRPRWQANTPENRFVKSLVARVETRLNSLLGLLVGPDFGPEQSQLQAWLTLLRKHTRACPEWPTIPALTAPAMPTLGLMARRSHRPFVRLWQQLNRDFVFVPSMENQPSQSSLSKAGPRRRRLENLPWLYQTWSLLHVILALQREAQLQGWTPISQDWFFPWQNAGRPPSNWVQVLPRGQRVLHLQKAGAGAELQVWVERQFGAEGAIHSISYAQRPDLVVQVSPYKRPQLPTQPTQPAQIWLWDAKYRLGDDLKRPSKVDLDRMHAYRDALRSETGATVVTMACILYPGPSLTFAPGLSALQASPLAPEDLQQALSLQVQGLLAGLTGLVGAAKP